MPPTTTPTTTLHPSGPGPEGPLARYLEHPSSATGRLADDLVHALAEVTGHAAPLAISLLVAIVGLAIVLLVARRRAEAATARGGRLVTVLAPPDVDPEGALTLWTNLVALLRPRWRRLVSGQPHLGFELTSGVRGLRIALWVPDAVPPGMVERAVEAAWPGARTETAEATAPLAESGIATGGQLSLAVAEWYPIKVAHRVDPLRPLLGALSGAEEADSACVQILARPITGRRQAALGRAATHRRNGRSLSRLSRLLDLVALGSTRSGGGSEVDPTRAADVSDILDKAAQPLWAATLRYAVATSDSASSGTGRTDTSGAIKARLRGRAHALASAFAVYSGRNRFERHRLRHPVHVLAARRMGHGQLFSVAELAALAHLPIDASVVGLARAGAKAVAPPPEVAVLGDSNGAKILGDAESGGRRPIALAVPDARHHLHVMGATGSGKSTLLTNLVLGDIEAGRGVVVIDPKGDLVTDLCERMPEGAEKRLVLIDPEELEAPPILNVLSGGDTDLVVDNVVGIFRSIFEAYWGPRTDDVLRAACLTLLRSSSPESPVSLADVPRLLSDDSFRAPKVQAVKDDSVGLGGFWKWYDAMSEANRAQVIGPVMNKLRAFLLRDFVRQVVGRPAAGFDMGQVLDGGICLVRVPKGIVGDETSKLLGSFVVAKVWQSVTHRARLGERARVDAALYVDECQNFLHLPRSFDEMLAEARGYGLSMVLAHQHLAQLPRDFRDAVSANARTKVWFSMSPEDAHGLSRHVTPELSEHDLSHLGAFQAAARLVVDGAETPAFTIRTRPAPAADTARGVVVRQVARRLHGTPIKSPGDSWRANVVPEEMSGDARGAR